MIKNLLKITFYAIITFCVISYISVMVSLLNVVFIGDPTMKPVTNIGFPYKYYYQFWLTGSDSPNCGWRSNRFILDGIITWILVAMVFFGFKKITNK